MFDFFLKNFDLAKILLLGLSEIGGGILEILAYLLLMEIGVCISFPLNWENIHCLNVISLSLVVSMFQIDPYIAVMNS